MRRLSPQALWGSSWTAAALFTAAFAVNLQAPLYGGHAEVSGDGADGVTIAFAACVGGLMPTLLLLGGISDRIGRRLPLAASLALAAGATVLLTTLPGLVALVVARCRLGVGPGLAQA